MNEQEINTEEMTMEQTFEQLQKLLDRMDEQELPLEESFRAYETGLKLVKACHDKLDAIEKQIIVLEENGNGED